MRSHEKLIYGISIARLCQRYDTYHCQDKINDVALNIFIDVTLIYVFWTNLLNTENTSFFQGYKMFHRILLAVDGSVKNRAAVSKALSMAKESGGTVTAVFVEDIGYRLVPVYYSIAQIDETAQKVFSFVRSEAESMGVEVDYKVAIGHAAKDIAMLSRDYDAVVCGTRGHTGVKRLVLGSVSGYLAKNSNGTTVVVNG